MREADDLAAGPLPSGLTPSCLLALCPEALRLRLAKSPKLSYADLRYLLMG